MHRRGERRRGPQATKVPQAQAPRPTRPGSRARCRGQAPRPARRQDSATCYPPLLVKSDARIAQLRGSARGDHRGGPTCRRRVATNLLILKENPRRPEPARMLLRSARKGSIDGDPPAATQRPQHPQVLLRQGRRGPGARRAQLRHPGARLRQHRRSKRLRQDHRIQHHRRPDRARCRRADLPRRGDRQPARARRLHDAEGLAVSLAHRAAERAARPGDARRRPGRGAGDRARAPQCVRPRRVRERLSEDAVGRHASARGADPHADHESGW